MNVSAPHPGKGYTGQERWRKTSRIARGAGNARADVRLSERSALRDRGGSAAWTGRTLKNDSDAQHCAGMDNHDHTHASLIEAYFDIRPGFLKAHEGCHSTEAQKITA
jgi:hypothetical protein